MQQKGAWGMPAISWASLDWEQQPLWQHRDPLASHRARQRNTGEFKSAVTPRIAEQTPQLSPQLHTLVQDCTRTITRFDEQHATLGGVPFAAVLLRGESASSSQIENLTVSARRLSLAVVGASSSAVGHNAELVARNVCAMHAALEAAESLTIESIMHMHHELTAGILEDAGKFRQQWVWVGGQSPVTADYVAPHWKLVPAAMNDLVEFLARRDLDPLVQAAIAHAQFETVHPFTDGNGRTGRALISALLMARGVTKHVVLPISSGLLHDVADYIAALTAYRAGDVEPIIRCFIQASNAAVENARILAEDLSGLRDKILGTARRTTSALKAVADFCCTEPAFTVQMVEQNTSVAPATIYRIITTLEKAGVIRREKTFVLGQRVWTVPHLNDALDAFAARAGRRVHPD